MEFKKALILTITFFIINHISLSQGFTGDTWAQALDNKQAKVILTNVQSSLFAESKTQSGICFDILTDFAEYVNEKYNVAIKYEYSPISDPSNFQSFLAAVENSKGGVFGLGDITITDERKAVFDFSPPFFSNVAILITKKSVPELTALSRIPNTFKGMKAVSQGGTTHDQRIQDLSEKYGFPIVFAASAADKTILVKSSPKYFTYIDLPNYLELYSTNVDIRRHPIGDVTGEYYGFVLPKGSDWTPIIAEFLNSKGGYMNSEDYQRVLRDNLGEDVMSLMRNLSR